jgi:hypothetical protein
VSQALFSDMKIAHAHYTAQDYFDESAEKYNEFVKFAFVRNPIGRFVSGYKHLLSPPDWVHSDTHAFSKKHVKPFSDINDFVQHLEQELVVREWVHFKPQTRFLLVNGEIKVDFIGRFESLETDIRKVAKLLGVDEGITMPHVNKSKTIVRNSTELTPESIRVLTGFYSDDFGNFGYEQ